MKVKRGEPAPIFEVPGEAGTRGRLLLVSCVFPPDPGVGARRWQKLSRFAHARGWALDVLTFDPRALPSRDVEALDDLPPGTRVFAVPQPALLTHTLSLAAWRGVQRLVRARASSPPAAQTRQTTSGSGGGSALETLRRQHLTRIDFLLTDRFAREAARIAARVVRPDHRAVVSSGPPHMAHEAARVIARASGIPFVMDMRDPWCSPELTPAFADPTDWLLYAERYERRCVTSARLVVANTELATNALRERYHGVPADRFVTVMNGADDDPLPQPRRDTRFVIAFAGTIYMGRDPRSLFAAVGCVVRELHLSPSELEVVFMGSVESDGTPPAVLAAEAGIANHFTCEPLQPRAKALELFGRAALLVSLPQDVGVAVPAKIFEYVRFDAWLLALAERGTATELVLRGTTADVVHPEDIAGIARVIRRHIESHRRCEWPLALNADGRYDRAWQAAILFDALDRAL